MIYRNAQLQNPQHLSNKIQAPKRITQTYNFQTQPNEHGFIK